MGKKSKKKKRAKSANESISLMDIIGRIYFVICIGFIAYVCIGIPILLHLLKTHGTRTSAVVTSQTSTWFQRWSTICYMYEFNVGGETYMGNSLFEERDSSKIGMKVQILYLDWYPSFNRPIYYWD